MLQFMSFSLADLVLKRDDTGNCRILHSNLSCCSCHALHALRRLMIFYIAASNFTLSLSPLFIPDKFVLSAARFLHRSAIPSTAQFLSAQVSIVAPLMHSPQMSKHRPGSFVCCASHPNAAALLPCRESLLSTVSSQ